MDEALEIAIARVGGEQALAEIAGVSRQAVAKWTRIPPSRVLAIAMATGLPKELLRPDIYPPEGDDR